MAPKLRTKLWHLRVKLVGKQYTRSPSNINQTEPCPSTRATERATTPYSSRSAEYRALKKVKINLSKTPVKRVRLIEKLACSPSTKQQLSKQGVVATPDMKEMAKVGESFIMSLIDLNVSSKKTKITILLMRKAANKRYSMQRKH